MPRWQRAYLAACAGAIAYLLAYLVTDYGKLPHLYYFQLEREWRLARRVAGLPSGYAGLWLWAIAAGVVVAAAAWLVLGRRRAPATDRTLGLALAWTMTAVVVSVAYFAWHNWP